ncbi:MAG: fatty acid hydroxylase [Ignavibacteriaceae bacterium]|nr:MAG: sterol desaturase family protein [Chlorobiota bacterium]GJQ32351.1 MAG: fatty acid hydroxylase [Ignavibacteriaceae bacterium]
MEAVLNYIAGFLSDITTLVTSALIVGSAGIMIFFERKYPYTKGQKFFREGFFNDLVLYTIVQSYVLGLIIGELIKFIDNQTGIQRLQLLADTPVWLIVLGSLIIHDFYIYWFHRWMHNNKYLWRLHEAHHSTKDVDWLSGSRSHAFEIMINQTIEFAPFILLGAPAEAAVIKGAISAIWGMWIHSNIDVNTGKLQYFINGPEMHRWHHSDKVDEAYNMNYATKFAFWDYLFGTVYFPGREKPKWYGIPVEFPRNFVKQFFFAFRRFSDEG